MNRQQFVEEIAHRYGISPKKAREHLDEVLDTMIQVLVTGKDRHGNDVNGVGITGFGVLESVVRAGRLARNPQTGERISLPSYRTVRFRAGRSFLDMMTGKKALPQGRSVSAKAPKSVAKKSPAPAPASGAE